MQNILIAVVTIFIIMKHTPLRCKAEYTAQVGQNAGASLQKVIPGVFWNILSSITHKNNLSLHPCYLGAEWASPQYFLLFSGVLPLSWSLLALKPVLKPLPPHTSHPCHPIPFHPQELSPSTFVPQASLA